MKKMICSILAAVLLISTANMSLILAQPKEDQQPRGSQSQDPPEKCKPPHNQGPECKPPPQNGKQPPPPPQQDKPNKPPKDKPPQDANNSVIPPQNQPPQN